MSDPYSVYNGGLSNGQQMKQSANVALSRNNNTSLSGSIPIHSILKNNPYEHGSVYGITPMEEEEEDDERLEYPPTQPSVYQDNYRAQPSPIRISQIQTSIPQQQQPSAFISSNATASSTQITSSAPQKRARYYKPLPTIPGQQLNSQLASQMQSKQTPAIRGASDFSDIIVSFPEYPELESQQLKDIQKNFFLGLLLPCFHFINMKNRNSSMPEVQKWARKSIYYGNIQMIILGIILAYLLFLSLFIILPFLGVVGLVVSAILTSVVCFGSVSYISSFLVIASTTLSTTCFFCTTCTLFCCCCCCCGTSCILNAFKTK